jgi:hypothetical protein
MLRFISWTNFLLVILILLLFYWFVVGLAYYRRELIIFFKQGTRPVVLNGHIKIPEDENFFDRCNDCASILKSVIRKSSLEQADKVSLISEIRESLYPFLEFKGSIWQVPINNLIVYESHQVCSISLNESDINAIWN